jgi:hypothetical protein
MKKSDTCSYLKVSLKQKQSAFLFFFWVSSLLFVPSLAFAKILVISDIDDTLKISHVASAVDALRSAFDDKSFFVGMPELFQDLAKSTADIEFHYVSLAPRFFMEQKHLNFLAKNNFPISELHMNPGTLQDPELKQKIIRKLLADKKPELVLYFGDNGQFDTLVYQQMTLEFPETASHTYIREVYSKFGSSKFPTQEGQTGFVTSVELALDLIEKGLLPAADYPAIEKLVFDQLKLESSRQLVGLRIFPAWQDCRDFIWKWDLKDPSEGLMAIEEAIAKKCRSSFFASEY